MANNFWIYPTKRQDEFYDVRKLMPLLKKEFPQFNFYYEDYIEGNPGDKNSTKNHHIITIKKDEIDLIWNYGIIFLLIINSIAMIKWN